MTLSTTGLQSVVYNSLSEADQDWQQLKDVKHSNPYHSPEWLAAWSDTFGKGSGIQPVTAVGRIDGKAVVILPLGLQRARGIRTLSFLGHRLGNQNTGIWDAAFYDRVTPGQMQDFLEHICTAAAADLLSLQNVPETWHGRRHPLLQAQATASPSPIFQRQLGDDFDDLFKATHSKSSRKNLARKQRHLQAAGGYRIVKARSADEREAGLIAFLEQRATRAAETGIPNAFSAPAAQEFLRRLIGLTLDGGSSGAGVLDLWLLETGGKIRATYLCAENAGTLYAYGNSVAHDDMLANSPGLILIMEIIAEACADPGLTLLDLGLGEERYKTAWADPVLLQDCLLARTWKGAWQLRLEMMRTRAKAAVRGSDRLWPLVRRLRKWKASRP